MEFESTYKVFKTSWGIIISIKGEIIDMDTNDSFSNDLYVTKNIYLRMNIDKSDMYIYDNIETLKKGIKWALNQFPNDSNFKCVVINQIDFNFCNFQIEGLQVAVGKWICDYYNKSLPNYDVEFDANSKKYIFNF